MLRARPAQRAIALATAISLVVAAMPTHVYAQQPVPRLPLIRDAEIEQLLRDYTQPILRAAGLAKQNIKVVIINEKSFNAFVMDGRHIFVNSGALMDSQTPNQIIGVLAHETGHIAGGHLSRLREEMAAAQTQAIIAMLLGVGAMFAGARAGPNTNASQIGAAAIAAPQELIRRNLLSYARAQEDAADRAGVKFLNATGQSAKGMHDTFKRFVEQTMFQARFVDPYVQSHPMPADRVAGLEGIAKASPYWDRKDPPELQLRHDMMRAKLSGFMERPELVARRFQSGDNGLPARYARAIASYRHGNLNNALAQIDALIAGSPNNPYFHELKGQALLEAGRGADAVAPLRRAVQLAPNPTLIKIMLAQALLATNNAKVGDEAVTLLRAALASDPDIPEAYTQLAMAYGRKGDLAQADLASAQAAMTRGDVKTARQLASRAKTRFAVGSPGWVKADDIVTLNKPKNLRRD
jgi:predicted Zn-dependent protease